LIPLLLLLASAPAAEPPAEAPGRAETYGAGDAPTEAGDAPAPPDDASDQKSSRTEAPTTPLVDPDPMPDPAAPGTPPPADVPPADAPPEEPLKSVREQRQEERAERRRDLFEGPNRKPEADFLRRDTELRVRLAFNGSTPGPFSLFTSLTGWNELSLSVDHGVASWRDFTVGVGVVAWYDQALLLGALSQPVANYDEWQFRWSMWEAGGAVRATAHWTRLQGVDPYLLLGLGAGLFHLDARVRGWPVDTRQIVERPYLRVEAGGGLNWRMGRSKFFVGVELRYLISSQIRAAKQVDLTHQGETATFLFFPQHKPPKGFCWVIGAGVRF
jgi:hypothetical protein